MADPMRKADKHYTYYDYLRWPDDERWELIDGEAWNMSPAPGRLHQYLVKEILWHIENYLRDRKCEVYPAPFDVLLPNIEEMENEDSISSVVQPDISVICDPDKLNDRGCTGPPDWIVEIVSPYTAMKDFDYKRHLYEHHGVREYWIVDPGNKFVHVYLLKSGKKGRYFNGPDVYEIRADTVFSKKRRSAGVPCSILEDLFIDFAGMLKTDR